MLQALAVAAVIALFLTGYWMVALAAALTMPYWLGPVVVRLTSKSSAEPAFEPFDPNEDREPARVGAYFTGVTRTLAAEGFTATADLSQRGYSENLAMRVRFFEGAEAGHDAIAFAGYTTGGDVRQLVTHVELLTELADGTVLITNNSPRVGVFSPSTGRELVQLPQLHDAGRLARAHRALVARRASPVAPSRYAADPARELAHAMVREMDAQVEKGLYWVDRAARAYRPTLGGAFLMCWRLLPPMRSIRTARMRRRAAALLRELGMDRPAPAAAAGAARPTDYIEAETGWLGKLSIAAVVIVTVVTMLPGFTRRDVRTANGDVAAVAAHRPALDSASDAAAASPPPPPLGDVAVPDDFDGAARALAELSGAAPDTLYAFTPDDQPERSIPEGRSFAVAHARAEQLLDSATHARFVEHGFLLFRTINSFGVPRTTDELALLPAPSKDERIDVVRRMGTDGNLTGPDNARIVEWLRALDREQPFELTGVGLDFVEARFTSELRDPDALARRVHAFCPDVVRQGTRTVAALAREIRETRTLYCWWD